MPNIRLEIKNRINNEKNPLRKDPVIHIVNHHTGSMTNVENMLSFLGKEDFISYHFLIDLEGVIYQLMDLDRIAYHAGVSQWGEYGVSSKQFKIPEGGSVWLRGINPTSIGVAVNSNGKYFSPKQKAALFNLNTYLAYKYNVEKENIVRHADITQVDQYALRKKIVLPFRTDYSAQTRCRKWDPGVNLWKNRHKTWSEYQDRIEKEVKKLRR